MGHNPKEIMKKINPVRMAKQRNHHFLVDHEKLAYLLPSIKLMIIARKNSHIQYNHTTNRVSQSRQYFHHTVKYIFTIQYPYNKQACYDSSINTLRLDLTHPDTYNLVRFSRCLHLWWISLLTPELCVTSGIMNQFSLTTRLALNEFQASCYSHHRSQSALGKTN